MNKLMTAAAPKATGPEVVATSSQASGAGTLWVSAIPAGKVPAGMPPEPVYAANGMPKLHYYDHPELAAYVNGHFHQEKWLIEEHWRAHREEALNKFGQHLPRTPLPLFSGYSKVCDEAEKQAEIERQYDLTEYGKELAHWLDWSLLNGSGPSQFKLWGSIYQTGYFDTNPIQTNELVRKGIDNYEKAEKKAIWSQVYANKITQAEAREKRQALAEEVAAWRQAYP